MKEELGNVIKIMALEFGKDIAIYDDAFLTKALEKRKAETGIRQPCEYLDFLLDNQHEAPALLLSLNNTFSEFFRDSMTFAILEDIVMPRIVSGKADGSEIRIWSAGSSTGQEPYSLAILLSEFTEMCGKETRFRIFATDISQLALAKAKAGIYDGKAIENVRKKHLDKYFVKNGSKYEIIPKLKQHIEFSNYDLLDRVTSKPPESIYGDFDIVMCCNVLLYYRDDLRQFMLSKLLRGVSAEGYFVTSQAEKALMQNTFNLKSAESHSAVFVNDKRGMI